MENPGQDTVAIVNTDVIEVIDSTTTDPVYGNARFKDVQVIRIDSLTFRIKGKAQIFEANFGWVIEDGHDELQTGHQMADAGAPD
ncbi:MAG: Gmad2 immunoglobulin-like domain-containing protein, partial [Bacteroidota bacterium]|nr:Gmad2 immunoglobulin-like domain-containing protein [Bacteroidota bacterium]